MPGKKAEADGAPMDKRITWMEQRVLTALRVKSADLKKCLDNEDVRGAIAEFLDTQDTMALYAYQAPGQPLTMRTNPPDDYRRKVVYFLKLKNEKVQLETISKLVTFGDLCLGPLESLELVSREVFLNLFSSPGGLSSVPEVVAKELTERFHRFLAHLHVVGGLTRGQTLLPLPTLPPSKRLDQKDVVHALETAVVQWTAQIRKVLAEDSEQLILAGGHPGPLEELQFWQDRATNLEHLDAQLHNRKVLRYLKLLQTVQSTYYIPFMSLLQDLQAAAAEAREIHRFLLPLKEYFECLHPSFQGQTDLAELVQRGLFSRLFHLIFLVWTNCQYYGFPARLVVLIQEICNDLIRSTRWHVGVEDLFVIEPEDAVKRLSRTLSICSNFKHCFFHYKAVAARPPPGGGLPNPWRFQNTTLFARLDAFLERCHDLLDLVELFILFGRLEKVEVGGTKGRELTGDVQAVHEEFLAAYDAFKAVPYDLLDVDVERFEDDFITFRKKVRELDRRLGSVLTAAFEEGIVIYSAFKVVDSFDDLLGRSLIQAEWLKRQGEVLQAYAADLQAVQEIIAAFKENPTVYASMPPTAGALVWCRGLMERISEPLARIETLNKSILETTTARETLLLAETLLKTLADYSDVKYEQWASEVGTVSRQRLQQHLLRRDPVTHLLHVNFDPQLVRLLREVDYIQKIDAFDRDGRPWVIPDQALHLHAHGQTFRRHVLALEAIAFMYNALVQGLLPVERPLVALELEKIDRELEAGISELDWNAHGRLDEFIACTKQSVTELDTVLQSLKNGVAEIQRSLEQFRGLHEFFPFVAKHTKTLAPEDLAARYREHHTAQAEDLTQRGQRIHDIIREAFRELNAMKAANEFPLLAQDSDEWRQYVTYMNAFVLEALQGIVERQLDSLRRQLDRDWLAKNNGIPLLDIKLLLAPGKGADGRPGPLEARFSPALEEGPASLASMVQDWVADYQRLALCIERVDMHTGNYHSNVAFNVKVNAVAEKILVLVGKHAEECRAFQKPFLRFDYLWLESPQRAFREFLHPPKRITEEGEEEESPDADPLFGVKLSLFEVQIAKYAKLYHEIMDLPSSATLAWTRVDAKPMKEMLKGICDKWKACFTGTLQHKVETLLEELFHFIKEAMAGLEADVSGREKANLKLVMGFIRDCKRRHKQATELMEPVAAVISILRKHDAISEATIARLEEMRKDAPLAWQEVYKRSLNRREQLSAMQDQEAAKIKADTAAFEQAVAAFRQRFMDMRIFRFGPTVEQSYSDLDLWDDSLEDIEGEAYQLRELQELFDLTPSDFKELKDCRADLRMLKQVWDLMALVDGQFLDWMRTPFKNVDTDFLLEEVKKLQKQLKACSVRMKSWECFKGLETKVRNMATSLPLVQDLRSPAMRERHWRQLLKVTKQTAHIDPESEEFSLKDLLGLGLHAYVDEVASIVEKATKELAIDKTLVKIIETWEGMVCSYERHAGLEVHLLGAVDDIVDVLEDHTNTLQTMLSNRFVEYFAERVNGWLQHLFTVEASILRWMEVQKQWLNLYPIFMLSEDIKTQLPDDARDFAACDELFRAMMDKAQHYTNVIELCTTDAVRRAMGRQDTLEGMLAIMQGILEQCEKALADYLETKKKIFPRFYFVSSADLVDILSKGSHPPSVLVHIGKIVDSLDTFAMEADQRTATAMTSREGEEVPLVRPYMCAGPVEEWLMGLIDVIFATVRALIADGYATYVENPRTQWIMLYPAQIVCYVSRTWFTLETQQAFDQVEDGNELALKEYLKQQKAQLDALIGLVLGSLSKGDRKKLVTLITVDVHSRDVLAKMVEEKVDSGTSFQWLSQLRYYWDDARGSVIDICDAEFTNGYEYIGNCGCLVITPLTDRCYITLSQALKLRKGGAPAGPAGTGKTETTKDLSRALGLACYVFNCSDQMDYKSLGQIFKGLSMSGSWGCFDEFNRIPVEVLSVVATQVKSILDAVKNNKKRFRFMAEEITLATTVGIFITMNPGYKGRAELPENLKALFRPCAMVVPDLMNICEIMLSAEGFIEAKDLAKKFVTLYRLNRQLLSQQEHYDWGLRAVKSVLVIAGELKRSDPALDERRTLLRALRDTNMAKLSKDDVYVFMKLIQALFPGIDVPIKVYPQLVEACRTAAQQQGLLPGENNTFITKCVQYKELLDVRHSVFIMGAAGTGKSSVWKTLAQAFGLLGDKTVTEIINPKAITSNELYGYIHPQSREWKDGLLSRIFRELALLSKTKKNSKWILLDGPIDAEWIESMNTVMDDNKMLTLASNERIPLTASMRMVFEISHLRNATPATVSRAGIIFMNETDVGWGPYQDRWIARRGDAKERNYLDMLFDKYVPATLEFWKRVMKPIVPMPDISLVQTVCYLLDGLLTEKNVPSNSPADVYERYFIFAVIWAFGGPLPTDGRFDYRQSFSNWWKKEFQTIKIAETGSVFDYFLDGQREFVPWTQRVERFKPNPDLLFAQIAVQTADTVRLTFVLDLLAKNRKPVLFVGTAGTGKTNMLKAALDQLDNSEVIYRVINFNSQTDSRSLQAIMEQALDKKGGRQYGPPGRKRLIFFLDDINMPTPDKYGTQDSLALLRMHFDYGFWYDRHKMTLKEIVNVQYLSAMNPKAGSFTVPDQLQWHYGVFACNMPERPDLQLIYGQILAGHLGQFGRDTPALANALTLATIELHFAVSKQFLPTAVKFHYQWNLREMSNIIQGVMQADPGLHDSMAIVRLWAHECERTFADRMVDDADIMSYHDIATTVTRQYFGEALDVERIMRRPNIWAPFFHASTGEDGAYGQVESYEALATFLNHKLADYNQEFAAMNLVLFDQAMQHVCHISRILHNPRGSALLVGVGGSGKQSLARLAAFLCGLDLFQVMVTSTYGHADFRMDVLELYKKCGLKSQHFCFILTDSQVVDPHMLVYLNDMLASGNIPDLFAPDEKESVENAMANEVKATGHPDYGNRDVCWEFFLSKVRNQLHLVLCFSPVGQQFRAWCMQFPSLANATVIDWFPPWPQQALVSVAARFLATVDLGGEEAVAGVAEHMAFVHEIVNESAKAFYEAERRHVYTTPKSFLELIALYKHMLATKRAELTEKTERLVTGLQKIKEAGQQVAGLKEVLQAEQVVVSQRREATAALLEHVGKEKATVGEQNEFAQAEETKTNTIVAEVDLFAQECEADVEAAKPIVEAALAALNQLDKAALTELKSMSKPPEDVAMVAAAVMVLTADQRRIPKDRSWANSKKMMANVTQWLKELLAFDANNIPQPCVDLVEPMLRNPNFDPEAIRTKSMAASSLCAWVINIVKYHNIRCEVRPKEERLAEAQEKLATSKANLKRVQDQVASLNARLAALVAQFEEASKQKEQIEAQARRTQEKLNLAERLVHGLADENSRWAATIEEMRARLTLLIGDVLLAAAFISYIGPFTSTFRHELVVERWVPDLLARGIPLTKDLDPVLHVMTTEAEAAGWNNEGLPADRISIENGAILTNCTRWPLLIDPQLQGVKWIKMREEKNGLRVLQPGQKDYLDELVQCLEGGLPCLMEALRETVDPILEPVLAQQYIQKGKRRYIKLGDKEVEYHPQFRLYMQTKLGNPHYRPEVAAQTTLINFMVTEDGLEDQLLAAVVNRERPDLEAQRVGLLRDMNQMKIDLQRCEDELLIELSNATGDILENVTLVENLETTKRTARQIAHSMGVARATTASIASSRKVYTTVAERGSLLFFQIDQLAKVDPMYQFSLEAFEVVFHKALTKAAPADSVEQRVDNIVRSITETLFAFVARGLFGRHCLTFSVMLCLAILRKRRDLDPEQLAFLLQGTRRFGVDRPDAIADWCPEASWAAVQALADVEGTNPPFEKLPEDLVENTRWRIWAETEKPEEEKLPTDWKNLTSFQRLLILRCLRPDRLTAALEAFVSEQIGKVFISDPAVPLEVSFQDSTPTTPIFFILSPGVDPVQPVETLGAKLGFREDDSKFFNVSLGQGQELVAEKALDHSFQKGCWVMLNNIHLVVLWLLRLEKILEAQAVVYARMAQLERRRQEKRKARRRAREAAEAEAEAEVRRQQTQAAADVAHAFSGDFDADGPEDPLVVQRRQAQEDAERRLRLEHERAAEEAEEALDPELQLDGPTGHLDFRVFLASDPSENIPIGVLQRCIKLTSEPPQGLRQNMHRALNHFAEETWENSSKQQEFKGILFALCFFHACVVERKKFGAQGWNRGYPFNPGDLTTCVDVLANNLEDRAKIPWEDLRYVFGEIMYGGHITDDWDRELCRAYLTYLVSPDVLEGGDLCAGFPAPPPLSHRDYLAYIEEACPPESPALYGLHPNAEINFRTVQGDTLFRTIHELASTAGVGGSGGATEKVRQVLEEIMVSLPDPHNLAEIAERLEDDRSPAQHVFYQECERMNALGAVVRKTLTDLDLGLKGALSMSNQMALLYEDLHLNKVPEVWATVAYMSMRPLGAWFQNLCERNQQLMDFAAELMTPKVVGINLFFNPNAFLTAIMQTMAMQHGYDLDQMTLTTEVTKKWPDQIDTAAREGSHVFGMFMEGARWDMSQSSIEDSRMKDLYPKMPVMTIRSLPVAKVDLKDLYACPVYKTQERGPGYVATLHLKTKSLARKWVIGGVALLLDVVE